jgi:hypothetical protein
MHRFDSAKVDLKLSPREVEKLIDTYFGTFSDATPAEITDLVLAYADHSRVCALLARGFDAVIAPFLDTFMVSTITSPGDFFWLDDGVARELQRRLEYSVTSLAAIR